MSRHLPDASEEKQRFLLHSPLDRSNKYCILALHQALLSCTSKENHHNRNNNIKLLKLMNI